MLLLSKKRLLTGFALLLLSSTPSFAVDAQAFGTRLQTVLKQQGISLSFSGAEEVGNDVLVRGAVVAIDDDAAEVGDLTFENVTGSAEEGFRAARLPIEHFGRDNLGTAWSANNIVFEGLHLAGTDPAATTPLPIAFYFRRLAVGEVITSRGGGADFKLSGTEILNSAERGGAVTSKVRFGDFEVDLSLHEPTDFLRVIEKLGYTKFSGSASGELTWDAESGDFQISPLRLSIKDAGEMEFSTSLSGLTRSFGASLGNVLEDDDPSTVSMLRPVSHISLKQLEIRLKDASFGDRLVDFYAGLTHLPREVVLENSSRILTSILQDLENEGFQNAIGSAVSELFNDPKSKVLSIAVEPRSPILGPVILGAAIANAETLPDVLGVQVRTVPIEPDAAAAVPSRDVNIPGQPLGAQPNPR